MKLLYEIQTDIAEADMCLIEQPHGGLSQSLLTALPVAHLDPIISVVCFFGAHHVFSVNTVFVFSAVCLCCCCSLEMHT